MALVSMKHILSDARKNHYAVPLFDVPSLDAAIGVIRAAENLQAPVMLGMYDEWFQRPEAEAVCAGMRVAAHKASVPVSLMLDHGSSYGSCIKALRYGFTDIMFDGSALPFEENAVISRMLADAAHTVGVGIEAELGHVGLGSDYDIEDARDHFTQPDMVERFLHQTDVDFLAIAFGTAHGEYKRAPELDQVLLKQLNAVSTVPLVMHGGSGLSNEQFLESIKGGICKINVATAIFKDFEARMGDNAAQHKLDVFTVQNEILASFTTVCMEYLTLFGTANRA